jgi:hypothetical protein
MVEPVADPTRTIEALLAALTSEVSHLRTDFERREAKDDKSREVVHRRLDDLVDRMAAVETTVTGVVKDVAEIKPVTDEYSRLKAMGKGYLIATAVGGSGMTFYLHDNIVQFLHMLKGG